MKLVTKPMKGDDLEIDNDALLDQLNYPLYVTPKLDCIRCLKKDGNALSSSFKLIPNAFIQKQIQAHAPDGLDGELMVLGGFNAVQSAIMSEDGEPNFVYNVFDYVSGPLEEPYRSRMDKLKSLTLPSFCQK